MDANVNVSGFQWLLKLRACLSWQDLCIMIVDSSQSLSTIKFAAHNWLSSRCRTHCPLSCGKSFLVGKLRTPSNCRSSWNPSRVSIVFVTTFLKQTMPLQLSCLTGIWLYILLSLDSTMTLVCRIFCRECTRLSIMPAETQSRNWRFCLNKESNLQTLDHRSIS